MQLEAMTLKVTEWNVYNIASNAWSTQNHLNTGRSFFGAVVADNGDFYVLGGRSFENSGAGGLFAYTIEKGSFAVNDVPVLTSTNSAPTANEGQTATNTGTISDPDGDVVTLTSSVGTVVNNGNWTWSWSFPTTDGPTQSQAVTISGDDGHGGTTQMTFDLIVNNVVPTATFANISGTIFRGESAMLAFSNQFDPSEIDTGAGFFYSYDCTNDGISEFTGNNATSFMCSYANAGTFTANGRIQDKDGG